MGSVIKSFNKNLFVESILIIVILLFAIFILTPRFWEPTVESWKQWAGARILRDTGGFSFFLGPLYLVYLQLFSFFDYPLSIQLEHVITHLFASLAIFFLLQKFMNKKYALLLTVAWIPHLAIVEPGGAVMGVGFLSLYLAPGNSSLRNKGFLPPALLAAAGCHTVYILFLVGHIIGTIVEKWKVHNWNNHKNYLTRATKITKAKITKVNIISIIITAGIIVLFVLTLIFPSTRIDNNHMVIDLTYAPISSKNQLTLAFFHLGNGHYIKSTFPKSEWIYKDWYFTNKEAFGGATTIPQALLNNPKTVINNMLMNLGLGIQMPTYFFAGKYLGPVSIFFWVFLFIGFFGLIYQLKKHDHFSKIISICLGVAAAVTVLTLTAFFTRYIINLLPVMLLILCHVAVGMSYLKIYLIKFILKFNKVISLKNNLKAEIVSNFLGGFCILLGILTNEWFLASLILPYKEFSFVIRVQIWAVNIFLIVLGILIIFFQKRLLGFIDKKIIKIKNEAKSYSFKKLKKITCVLVVTSAILLLITAPFPLGKTEHIKAVFNSKAFLSEAQPFGMVSTSQEFIPILDKNAKVLALEHNWVQAFTDVDLNNIYQIWSLPPFTDPSGEVQKTLCNLDVIFVSSLWSTEAPSVGTQAYLRYLLHIKPFLKSNCATNFKAESIGNNSVIYIRKNQIDLI